MARNLPAVEQMVRLKTPKKKAFDGLLVQVVTVQLDSLVIRVKAMEDRIGEVPIYKGAILNFTLDQFDCDFNIV